MPAVFAAHAGDIRISAQRSAPSSSPRPDWSPRDRPAFSHPGAAVPRGGIGVTSRKREPQRDTDADHTAREAMFAAADDYRGRFGEAVGTWERELRAAIARGQPVTM